MIIVLEGIDASGKATQAKRLTNALGGAVFDFPHYQSRTGQAILGLLTGKWSCTTNDPLFIGQEAAEIRALVLQSLMTTNRLEVFDMLTHYARHPERHLVLDRYYTSGLVYGQADGLPLDYLFDIHKALPPADLWLLIDIPPEESIRRRPERRDEYERRAGFMEKVALGYMELFRVLIPGKPSGKWVVVDGLGTADEVHERIMAEARSIL